LRAGVNLAGLSDPELPLEIGHGFAEISLMSRRVGTASSSTSHDVKMC
jgi:hypothetical protein